MRDFLSFILIKLKDQRGEAGEDIEEVEEVEETIDEDDDVVEINPDDLLEDDDDPEEPGEDETDDGEALAAQLKERDDKLAKQEKKIKEMNRSFYGMRKELKSMKDVKESQDTTFTDEQLRGIIDKNRDDPDVMLQIMKQVAKQTGGDAAKGQVDAANISTRRKELDLPLTKTWPDAHDEGSEDHASLQEAKDYFYLTDHPLGDFLAGAGTALMQMDDVLEKTKKEARKTALNVESKRKKIIKGNSLQVPKNKDSKLKALSKDSQAVAKQIGLSPSATKIYETLLQPGKNNATVEV